MAIEIRELVIKAFVDEAPARERPVPRNETERERLIQDCVERVMQLLRQERER